MATISAGDALARLASYHPHQEIIRYEHKNVKWTLKHVNYYSDALACGLLDAGLQPGDVVLSWLPLHFSEQVSLCSLIACIVMQSYDRWRLLYWGTLGNLFDMWCSMMWNIVEDFCVHQMHMFHNFVFS
jgi:hypothetical protein